MDLKVSWSCVYSLVGLLMFSLCFSRTVFGQIAPMFKGLRYDEDYSAINADTVSNVYWKLKHLRLGNNNQIYLSLGGEARYQYFKIENEDWGDTPESSDGFFLVRYLAHADLHLGVNLRIFTQTQSSLAARKIDVSPIDENPFELHQLFADYSIHFDGNRKLTFRLGRQELLYGSQRLISVREGPNNRQSFDGIKYILALPNRQLDMFYSHFVQSEKGILDDRFTKSQKLWGSYFSLKEISRIGNLDIYYIGFWRRNGNFDDAIGRESRHSIGGRIWNDHGKFTYDIEGVYQFGMVGSKKISAWTISTKINYVLEQKFDPNIGLKMELISGDKRYDDQALNTFNPMFPNGGYFGLAALFGPLNLVDFHPSMSLTLTKHIAWSFDHDIFWRFSRNDGIYTINGRLIYSGRNNPSHFIGHQFSTDLRYRPWRFLALKAEFKWFVTGSFLKNAGTGKDILFTLVSAQFTF
jgi:hypothetical protein